MRSQAEALVDQLVRAHKDPGRKLTHDGQEASLEAAFAATLRAEVNRALESAADIARGREELAAPEREATAQRILALRWS